MGRHTGHFSPLQSFTYNPVYLFQVPLHIMHTTVINYSVDDEVFAPDTKYAARVRTGPDQVKYHGQWSDWSSEVYWETESAVNGESLSNNQLI